MRIFSPMIGLVITLSLLLASCTAGSGVPGTRYANTAAAPAAPDSPGTPPVQPPLPAETAAPLSTDPAAPFSRDERADPSGQVNPAEKAPWIKELDGWGKGRVNALAWSPDGKQILISSTLGVSWFDPATFEVADIFTSSMPHLFSAFSPDTATLAVRITDENLKVYDRESGVVLAEMESHIGDISDLAFSPDGRLLAASGGNYANEAFGFQIWEAATGKLLLRMNGFQHSVWSIAFSPDSRTIATGTGDFFGTKGIAQVWDVSTGELLASFPSKRFAVWDVSFSPDGTLLAVGSLHCNIRLWDLVKKKIRTDLPGCGLLTFSPDGTWLAASNFERKKGVGILLWNIAADYQRVDLRGDPPIFVESLAFSPDGRMLAGANNEDGTLWVWDVEPDAAQIPFIETGVPGMAGQSE